MVSKNLLNKGPRKGKWKQKRLQKFYLSVRQREGRSIICTRPRKRECMQAAKIEPHLRLAINKLKIIIFLLNYPTLIVCNKTIIHLSVRGLWILTEPRRAT